MTEVFVERRWPAPMSQQTMQMMMAMGAGCLALHRVAWCGSWLSSDGTESYCHFQGADAESVRIAGRDAPAAEERVWACRIHDAPSFSADELRGSNVIVMRSFDEPTEAAAMRALEAAAAGLFEAHQVRFVRTHVSSNGRRMACLYRAPDEAAAARIQREAGLPFDLVRGVRQFGP